MGEEIDISPVIYYKDNEGKYERLGSIKETQLVEVHNKEFKDTKELIKKWDELISTVEFTIKNMEDIEKILDRYKHISRKRFRKLLYSIGYGRNAANEIIDMTWKLKGYYDGDDIEYWKRYINYGGLQ